VIEPLKLFVVIVHGVCDVVVGALNALGVAVVCLQPTRCCNQPVLNQLPGAQHINCLVHSISTAWCTAYQLPGAQHINCLVHSISTAWCTAYQLPGSQHMQFVSDTPECTFEQLTQGACRSLQQRAVPTPPYTHECSCISHCGHSGRRNSGPRRPFDCGYRCSCRPRSAKQAKERTRFWS
jgi:hypothetical protein